MNTTPQYEDFRMPRALEYEDLKDYVNTLLAKGFVPTGGITKVGNLLVQPLARPVPVTSKLHEELKEEL